LLCVCISRRVGLCGGSDTLDLGLLLGLELFRRPLTTLVVGVGRRGEEVRVLVACGDGLGIGCPSLLPLFLHGCTVDLQAACKGLNRRKETLLQADNEQARGGLRPARSACKTLLPRGPVLVEQAG